MNFCKQIRIVITQDKTWVEYEQKTATSKIETNGLPEAVNMASALMGGVDQWVEEEKK